MIIKFLVFNSLVKIIENIYFLFGFCCSDDSAPGAIRFSDSKNGLDTIKQLTAEESQAQMKRYLQCPGMCRVEVLKKFVRNKYNVDTNRFYVSLHIPPLAPSNCQKIGILLRCKHKSFFFLLTN